MISLALTFAVGAFTWTLLEYVIHRWLGHHRRLRGNPFGVEHTRHHAEGNYFAATVKKLGVAAVVAVVLGGPAVLIAGAHGGAALVGFLAMYGSPPDSGVDSGAPDDQGGIVPLYGLPPPDSGATPDSGGPNDDGGSAALYGLPPLDAGGDGSIGVRYGSPPRPDDAGA